MNCEEGLIKHPGAHPGEEQAPVANVQDVEKAVRKEDISNARACSSMPLFLSTLMTSIGLCIWFLVESLHSNYKYHVFSYGVLMAMAYCAALTICVPMCGERKASKKAKVCRYIALAVYQITEGILIIMLALSVYPQSKFVFVGPPVGVVLGIIFGALHRKYGLNLLWPCLALGLLTLAAFIMELEFVRYVPKDCTAFAVLTSLFAIKTLVCFAPPKCPVD